MKEEKVAAYIPVSESLYKLDDTKFMYNKDSDQWFCEMWHGTTSKTYSISSKLKENSKPSILENEEYQGLLFIF